MKEEGWLVKKDRVKAMRFFPDKHLDEDGTKYMRIHYACCKYGFHNGITSNVQLYNSERMTYEAARELWISTLHREWEVSKEPLWMTK